MQFDEAERRPGQNIPAVVQVAGGLEKFILFLPEASVKGCPRENI